MKYTKEQLIQALMAGKKLQAPGMTGYCEFDTKFGSPFRYYIPATKTSTAMDDHWVFANGNTDWSEFVEELPAYTWEELCSIPLGGRAQINRLTDRQKLCLTALEYLDVATMDFFNPTAATAAHRAYFIHQHTSNLPIEELESLIINLAEADQAF